LSYMHLNHPVVERLLAELGSDHSAATTMLRLGSSGLPAGVPLPQGPGLWAVYRLSLTNHDDVNRQHLVSVFIGSEGQSHPRLAEALLEMTPDQAETAFIPPTSVDLTALSQSALQLAEQQAGDLFSESQLDYAQQSAAEREKMERYYQQQETAVSHIAIENIRQAKQRELLQRRRDDLDALDRRTTLVPDLALVGMAVVGLQSG